MKLLGRPISNGKKIVYRDIEVTDSYSTTGTIKLNRKVVEVVREGSELTSKVPVWKVK